MSEPTPIVEEAIRELDYVMDHGPTDCDMAASCGLAAIAELRATIAQQTEDYDDCAALLLEARGEVERLMLRVAEVEASNERMAKTLEYGGNDWPPVESDDEG